MLRRLACRGRTDSEDEYDHNGQEYRDDHGIDNDSNHSDLDENPVGEIRGLERIVAAHRSQAQRVPFHDVSERAKALVLSKQFECAIGNPNVMLEAYEMLRSQSLVEAQERAKSDEEAARRHLNQ